MYNDSLTYVMSNDTGIHRISIAFMIGGAVQSRSMTKRVRDRVISWWTGHEYTHCEFVFRFNSGKCLTCAVNVGLPVTFYENKPYNTNIRWKLHEVSASENEAKRIFDFCCQEHDLKKGYNSMALWWNFLPITRFWPINNKGKTWFCSEFILAALQHGKGIYLENKPWLVAPDDLVQIISSDQAGTLSGGPAMYSDRLKLII